MIGRLPRPLTVLLATFVAVVLAFTALGPTSVLAAPTVTGTWSCCGSGTAAVAQTWTITESGGSLSGSASNGSGTFSPISGSVSGTSVTIVTGPYTGDPSYTATFVGTISGETMSGTWSGHLGTQR